MSWGGVWFVFAIGAGIGITLIILEVIEYVDSPKPVTHWQKTMDALARAVRKAQQ